MLRNYINHHRLEFKFLIFVYFNHYLLKISRLLRF